jgi:hypothetical protein
MYDQISIYAETLCELVPAHREAIEAGLDPNPGDVVQIVESMDQFCLSMEQFVEASFEDDPETGYLLANATTRLAYAHAFVNGQVSDEEIWEMFELMFDDMAAGCLDIRPEHRAILSEKEAIEFSAALRRMFD